MKMTKIAEAFQNKKAFIGFLTAGDPSLECTEEFIIKMEEAGAALIEIGIPFSDPIAEGPVIQSANVRALSNPNGCTTDQVFEMVERVSKIQYSNTAMIASLHAAHQQESQEL